MGYGVIARRLFDDPATIREGNRYWKWIQNYVAEDYTTAVNLGRDLVEKHAVKQSTSRIEELAKIFIHATNVSRIPAQRAGFSLLTVPRWRRVSGIWALWHERRTPGYRTFPNANECGNNGGKGPNDPANANR